MLFISFIVFQLWGHKRSKKEYAGAKTGASRFLSSSTREWWFWTTDPLVRLFVKLKLGPNALTAIGFTFSILAGLLFSQGWFGYAGWTMMVGASFDMFDGRVARITGKTTRSGAFFDAVMDRFGEGICLLGLAWYFRENFMLAVVIIALIGSLLVSYTKARAEGMDIECNVGTMQRPERIVYLGVASIFDPIVGVLISRWWTLPPPILVMIALSMIALMTTGTAIYRMIHVMNALDTEDKREKESIPQLITKLYTHEGREELWERARYGYDRSRASFSHVVLFLMGGINTEIMSEIMQRGDLPNISMHILERGSAARAVSTFPSAPGPALTPFVTGCFPGTCDIPGGRWFDRTVPASRVLSLNRFRDYSRWGAYAMDRDLSKSVRTIFEYSKRAVNIFGMLNRGAGLVRDPAFFRLCRRFQRTSPDPDPDGAKEAAFHWFTSAIRRDTDFVLYSLPPVECPSRSKGEMELACHALREIDNYVGRATGFLKSSGMYDSTALLFAATHGSSMACNHFDLGKFLGRRYKTCPDARVAREWHDTEIIALPSGSSMVHMYVRNGPDWSERSFFEDVERRGLIGSLLEEDGIDIIMGRSVNGGITVQSRRGRAHILEDADGRITYMVIGGDPFGYNKLPQVMDVASAFASTALTDYPDGILQSLQLFRSRRTGDIVVSAKGDVSLSGGDEKTLDSTCGSLVREHMIVPFISSVPIAEGELRTADIFAMIIDLFGIEPEHAMDGVVPPHAVVSTEKKRETASLMDVRT